MAQPFKVSTGLKDLIGKDLITNEFVAVFELVKNSFDARARTVQIFFDNDRIVISDNGKGMSRSDILNKWLFVAYSAKRDGTEDDDYREGIAKRRRAYAGAKGVGRFSCDRLGAKLLLSSRAKNSPVQYLEIDWTLFEKNPKKEFGEISFNISESDNFSSSIIKPKGKTGTVLEIVELRSKWDRETLLKLKRELAKLINPFSVGHPSFEIDIIAHAEKESDITESQFPVNGKVENKIIDVLKQRTTSVRIEIVDDGEHIETTLEDRGEKIYRIKESNPYEKIKHSDLEAEISFLNLSAKAVFARRMGLPSVQFGSIFLFRNGFRIFPVGEESDDFFGLDHRHQQGTRRFLSSRNLIGRVEVLGVEGFDEATSRDQGLIRTPEVLQLIECVRDKCIRRLERYVVDISWKDRYDKDVANLSRMKLDESSAKIANLVSKLAATKGMQLLDYNPELVRIVDEKSSAFESSLKALEVLAQRTGNESLLSSVADAASRFRLLQIAEAEAREAERRAEARATKAESAKAAEIERNQFLVAAASLDEDTILNLHHQIIVHASDVHINVKRMMGKLRNEASVRKEEWISFLETISFRNSQILTASRFATKGGYKHQSSEVEADLSIYIQDYIKNVASLWAPQGIKVEVDGDDRKIVRSFRPIEVGIVIDNLVSNAEKARATQVCFLLKVPKGPKTELVITVADDGNGWPQSIDPIERIFEKGVTTTDGSGLGLYHIKQVIERLGGTVEAHRESYSKNLNGAQLTLRVPA